MPRPADVTSAVAIIIVYNVVIIIIPAIIDVIIEVIYHDDLHCPHSLHSDLCIVLLIYQHKHFAVKKEDDKGKILIK